MGCEDQYKQAYPKYDLNRDGEYSVITMHHLQHVRWLLNPAKKKKKYLFYARLEL